MPAAEDGDTDLEDNVGDKNKGTFSVSVLGLAIGEAENKVEDGETNPSSPSS